MTIHVRMVAQKAMAVAAGVRGQVAGLGTEINKTNRLAPLGQRHLTSLMKFGNQLQWTGRMLQYNFTLPILAAGAAATHFALEQDKAMTHVAKVYGDTEAAAKQFRKEMGLGRREAMKLAESYRTDELEALDEAFTAISNHYGVQKKEVNEVAGAWAAAGASGLALAESVNTTMKAIIIGDMQAGEATKALISIQAQYNLSTQELMATLANLNSVENQTGAQMQDLIIGFEKAAGVARSAGIETQQLAAYMAALVPATGSAASAGNALKTMISRLMSPTKEAKQVMEAMGLEVTAMNWQSATATERLQLMAKEFNGLGSAAQGAAASVIASRWQVNRFEILMRELINTNGYYVKALKASEDQGASFRRMQEELNTVLESDPRRMQRMLVMLQNASVQIIQPLIPHIIYLVNKVAELAQGFADLSPEVQKFVLIALVLLAAIGPIIRYMGALWTLVGVLGFAFGTAAKGALHFGKALIGGVLTPLKMMGTVFMGAVGGLSSLMIGFFTGIASIFTGAFGRITAFTVRFWTIQIGIWKAGAAMLMLNTKLFYLSFLRFWAAVTLVAPSRWAAMWVVIKTISVAAFMTQGGLLTKFAAFWTRMWALTATVTTSIWGRMLVGLLLLSKTGFKAIGALAMRVIPVLFGPWGIAIAAVVGILYTFRDQIKQIFNNVVAYFNDSGVSITGTFHDMGQGIVDVFNSLPQAVQDAMVAVVTVIREAALAVYDWFQYINPWAQHSPSLVDNVRTGMEAVERSFSGLSNIKKHTSAAYAEIKRFGELTAKLGVNAQQVEIKQNRKDIKKAGGGAALQSFDKLQKMLGKLRPMLASLEGQVNRQEAVVAKWERKLEEANDELDKQQKKLDKLQDKLDKYQGKLDAAQEKLSYYASAPLQGMRAMEDQIFSNQMAQNALRLEMMKMEDVVGTFDDVKNKIEAINGAQELMRGEQKSLRAAGAGSDILGFYDDEIKKLEEQKGAYSDTFDTLNNMQNALDQLAREAERLDLVKSLQFDTLTRQIEQAADRTKELSFEEIMNGIRGANAEIDKYTPLVEKATEAVEEQQQAVDRAIIARDQVQERLEKEQATLEVIRNKYNEVNDAISAIENSINDVVAAAQKLNDALDAAKDKKKAAEDAAKKSKSAGEEPYISPGLQNFLDAGKADFPDPGGAGIPPRSDWTSQADDIKKFTEQLGMDTAAMFDQINPFKPLKEKAIAAWEWIKDKAKDYADKIGEFFSAAFEGVGSSGKGILGTIKDKLEPIGEFITEFFKDILKVVKAAVDLLWPEIKSIGERFWKGLKSIWETVGPKLAEFKELWGPMGEAISNFWDAVKPLLMLFIGAILLVAKTVLSAIGEAIEPLLKLIGGVLGGIIDIIKGFIKIIIGIFTGDWKMVWDGVVDIVTGTWDAIWAVIKGAGEVLWGLVKGIVTGIWDFFVWLKDELVDHSVVPDMIDAIIVAFQVLIDIVQWLWKNVLKPIYDLFVTLWNNVGDELGKWWGRIKNVWDGLLNAGTWFWNNVLKPVWQTVQDVWDNNVKPELSAWWDRIKTVWNFLLGLGSWFWNNVLKPVWQTIQDIWDKNVKPELEAWWGRIHAAWNFITGLGTWFWNNVLSPVWQTIKGLWTDNVKGELEAWWDRVKTAFSNLTSGIGGWWEREVTDPIYNKITGVWDRIAKWFTDNPNVLKNAINPVIKGVLGAINFMIRGLNKVSDVLPGDLWNIDEINTDHLAAGGPIKRKGNRGFMTQGARAIVGEGKANHPEFVIPTDPTYRNRARGLLAMAAQKIGLGTTAAHVRNSNMTDGHGIPMFAAGGWLKDKWNSVKNIGKKIADLPKNAVSKIMDKVLDTAGGMVDKIGYQPVESPPEYAIKKLRSWVTNADAQANAVIDSMVPSGGDVPVGTPDNPSGTSIWKGGRFTNRFIAHMEKAEQLANAGLLVIQGGFRPATSYSGTSHQADAIDFQVNNALIHSLRRVGIAAGDRTGLGDWEPHSHAIPGPSAGVAGGSAVWQWQDYIARGGINQPLNSSWGLKTGGIVRARTGGTRITAGEGGQDEAVIPLPHDWRNGVGGKTEIHIHGDLSFPNITDPADVDLFIQNLENMAKD